MARNEIADLYVIGTELVLEQGDHDSVKVWLQKLNDIDHGKAMKKANAAQAKVLAVLRDEDSEDYLAIASRAYESVREDMVDRIMQERRARVLLTADARLAEEEEWSKDGYLDGLRSAWNEGLQQAYLENPEDPEPEAAHVLAELTRFSEAVREEVDSELAGEAEALSSRALADLQDEVIPLLVKEEGVQAWLNEYHRCEVWLGTRRCTHDKHERPILHREMYFESRAAVDEIQQTAYLQLTLGMQQLTVPAQEGKDSPETPTSSDSSEPPGELELVASSGPAGAPA